MTKPPYSYHDADRAHATGAFIENGASYPPKWVAQAAAFRDSHSNSEYDLPYGTGVRQQFDIFYPKGQPQGTLTFIHGGYWLAFDRKTWSHLAQGALARSWTVAMPSYTLAPEARLSQMTQEVLAACKAIAAHAPGPMVVTGHSAGGHLSARMAVLDAPTCRVVPISPLAELETLLPTKMNEKLQVTAEEAALESPARQRPRQGVSTHVWVGGGERPSFLWQARGLAEEWNCDWTVDPKKHHFDVLDPMMDPNSALMNTLLDV